MKVRWVVLFLYLAGFCFLIDYPAYGSPLKSDNEQLEPYLEKLQANIVEEEKAVELLKKRYEDILRKKQNPKEQEVKKGNKEPDAPQSEKIAREAKLKDLEAGQDALRQKNQELLNSLEQSSASIQKKDQTIEELKKNRSGRDTAQPEPCPDKKGNEKRKKEIKEGSLFGKSIDSKNLGNDQTFYSDLSRENKPGILNGFLGQARKLDSWWRKKVW